MLGKSLPPTKPHSAPPSQVLGLCQRPSQAGRKGKKGARESLLRAAQALRGRWYSWYVMSFSWVLAGREQGGQGGLPRALLGAEMAP